MATILFITCKKDDNTNKKTFGVFKVLMNDTTIEMDGEIESASLNDFNELVDAFPNISRIEIVNCDGSSDDGINLLLSQKIHQKGINIHLLDNAIIASGGVDFYLAGIIRTRGIDTSIGVHSWEDSDGTTATDYPVGHEDHLQFIDYYVSVGFTQLQAEEFYYFTINAAPADSIYWMTEAEIDQYNITTQ